MSSRRSVAMCSSCCVCVWVKGRGECERDEVSVREMEAKICFMMFLMSRDENYGKLYSSQDMFITLPNTIVQFHVKFFSRYLFLWNVIFLPTTEVPKGSKYVIHSESIDYNTYHRFNHGKICKTTCRRLNDNLPVETTRETTPSLNLEFFL